MNKHHRFDCRECGAGIAVDEDGCCTTCGADAEPRGPSPIMQRAFETWARIWLAERSGQKE